MACAVDPHYYSRAHKTRPHGALCRLELEGKKPSWHASLRPLSEERNGKRWRTPTVSDATGRTSKNRPSPTSLEKGSQKEAIFIVEHFSKSAQHLWGKADGERTPSADGHCQSQHHHLRTFPYSPSISYSFFFGVSIKWRWRFPFILPFLSKQLSLAICF